MTDLVAIWEVPLCDGVHKLEFEHGTKSGKRIIRMDGQEILRKSWLFKLIGKEAFLYKGSSFVINIDTGDGLSYVYRLTVNGKEFEKFTENQSKIMKCWEFLLDDNPHRAVLGRDTMDVWVNGEKKSTANHFIEDGTEINFEFEGHVAFIRSTRSGNKREGQLYSLIVDGSEILSTTL